MGQLEKYGLYVLCLVIFLILGVSIWGTGEAPPPGQRTPPVAINAAPPEAADAMFRSVENASGRSGSLTGDSLVDALLRPTAPPKAGGAANGAAVSAVAAKNEGGAPAVPDDVQRRDNVDPVAKKEAASPASTRSYTIRKGDTLGGIAARELGSSRRVGEIERLNPVLDALRLQPGKVITLPARTDGATPKTNGEALQRAGAYRSYTVVKGDTFDAIARKQLGSSRRIDEIRQLNPGVDPRSIKVGQTIKLPVQ